MTVRDVTKDDYKKFEGLFIAYFNELDCEDDPLHIFSEYVICDLEAGLISAAVAQADGECVGFIIYQTDDVINDWCFKDGWGDVRELYVAPSFRRRGIGRQLLTYAESRLIDRPGIYMLPTEESEAFFIECGYEDICEYCADLDSKVFGKICTEL